MEERFETLPFCITLRERCYERVRVATVQSPRLASPHLDETHETHEPHETHDDMMTRMMMKNELTFFEVAGHARPVAPGERARAVRASAVDLVVVEQEGARVPDGHEHHAVVRQLCQEGERRGLLTAPLSRRRDEYAGRLADEPSALPQAPRGVQNGLHLGGEGAEPGGEAFDGGGGGERGKGAISLPSLVVRMDVSRIPFSHSK